MYLILSECLKQNLKKFSSTTLPLLIHQLVTVEIELNQL